MRQLLSVNALRIAVDTGGTFTDCLYVRDGRLEILKIPSTPDNPAKAIGEAVQQILAKFDGTAFQSLDLACGTTIGTNALLQRRGGRVVLLTTAGFEDILEIGRQARPKLYDFFVERPSPLVLAEHRIGLRERISAFGRVVTRPTTRDIDVACRRVLRLRPDCVAVCFLFSFANPGHERAAASRLRALGCSVTASHEVLPEFREFERTSTTVANAFLIPVMSRYLSEIRSVTSEGSKRHSHKSASRIRMMQSNGGSISAGSAAREPVRTILSGPAGGVVGAQYVAGLAGFTKIISFDMGGTSTDVALLDGELRTTNEAIVADLPVAVPMLDIHTVGAGGGSIARLDAAGALCVGPESAGADPGPIAYGKGDRPTVTDANLVLGRLGGNALLGGRFPLDGDRARHFLDMARRPVRAITNTEQFAHGILDVAEAVMERAIRVISVERGHDPRDYALVAFGGAGGLHACALAAALDIPRVLIPKFPGALSALGILRADVVRDTSRTILAPIASRREISPRLRRVFRDLETTAFQQMWREGFSRTQIRAQRFLDLRYVGQGYELEVPAAGDFLAGFHRLHERRFGHADPSRAVEVVNVRTRLIGLTSKPPLPRHARAGSSSTGAVSAVSNVYSEGRFIRMPIYERDRLRHCNRFSGPAVIRDYSATTFLQPGWRAYVDAYENLIFTRGK